MLSVAALVAGPAKEIRKTVPLEAGGRVYVQSSRGSVEVTAWEREQVEIEARVEPRDFLGDQRACVTETDVRVDAWPNSIRITPEYAYVERRVPRFVAALFRRCTEQPLVHYRIKVPRMARLVIVSSETRVSVQGVEGKVEVRSEARQ